MLISYTIALKERDFYTYKKIAAEFFLRGISFFGDIQEYIRLLYID